MGDEIMLKSKIMFGALAVIFLAQPCLADDPITIPDLSHSVATIAYNGPGTPTLLVVPDGNGNLFAEAHDEDGNVVDATITLTILDSLDVPIANFPFEDCWLESLDGGMVPCIGGTTADFNTDALGETQWVYPLRAAGYSEAPVLVLINGDALHTNPGLPLNFNSPDINGDGIVNLTDVAIFSNAYFSGYQFRCDLFRDGLLNLSDIPIFATHFTAQCP